MRIDTCLFITYIRDGNGYVFMMPKTYIGIDNGVSGAIAILRFPEMVQGHPLNPVVELYKMPVLEVGKSKTIDAAALNGMLKNERSAHIVFEQGQKQPKF